MRTLVISDLHLGNRTERDVLRRAEPRERLLDALEGIERLVLLGDVAELVTRHPERSMTVAEPVLRAIGERLGEGKEVLMVPGNHDWPLLGGWSADQGPGLGLDALVAPDASANLARIVSWLGPARVRVHYPGVWLDPDTYVTHGHYLDDLLVPHAPIGFRLSWRRHEDSTPADPWLYEQRHIERLHHISTRPPRRGPGALFSHVLNPLVPQMLRWARRSSLTAAGVDFQMRRMAAPALRTVLARLEVPAKRVIFAHVHRLGPMGRDGPRPWSDGHGPQLFNTGSWMYERLLLEGIRPPHPYWPGGAILLEPGSDPRPLNLLDGLSHEQLRGPRRLRSVT
ncbi:MAG: metallophosphoesterase [Solirubrobacteraceae bacterium]